MRSNSQLIFYPDIYNKVYHNSSVEMILHNLQLFRSLKGNYTYFNCMKKL